MTAMFPPVVAADRYDALLARYVPLNEPEHIRKQRKRLMTSDDIAAQRLSNPESHTHEALVQYEQVAALARRYKYKLQNLGNLKAVADQCLRLLQTASTFDTLEGSDVDG